jgi:hypothetical protein
MGVTLTLGTVTFAQEPPVERSAPVLEQSAAAAPAPHAAADSAAASAAHGDDHAAHGADGAHGHGEHHGLPTDAPRFNIGPFMVTNSMILTWIVTLVLIAFARIATWRMKEIPEGAQNVWEWLVEGLRDFLEGIIGRDLVKKTFWFFATIFIFILLTNWFGLIPGVGTIGWGIPNAQAAVAHRPANPPRRKRRPEHDLRNGDDLLRLLDLLGAAGERPWWFHHAHLRAQG